MRFFIISILTIVYGWAHPVTYTIDLKVNYDEVKKEITVHCKSDSRNKCGLHNFHFLNKDETIIKTAKFPFLKKKTTVAIDKKPAKMVFYLRKIPEHIYTIIIE